MISSSITDSSHPELYFWLRTRFGVLQTTFFKILPTSFSSQFCSILSLPLPFITLHYPLLPFITLHYPLNFIIFPVLFLNFAWHCSTVVADLVTLKLLFNTAIFDCKLVSGSYKRLFFKILPTSFSSQFCSFLLQFRFSIFFWKSSFVQNFQFSPYHYPLLHFITLHYPALPFITLHYPCITLWIS